MISLKILKTDLYKRLETKYSGELKYSTPGSAGIDLRACIETPIEFPVWSMSVIPCGIKLEIPEGYVGLVFPRSGLARDFAIDLANAVWVMDSDFRGELAVMLRVGENRNVKYCPVVVRPMDRIAQLVIMPYIKTDIVFVNDLTDTSRGTGGFGSAGHR